MAVSDIEAVLEFMRKYGLSDSESALMEDILEKPELGAAVIPKFVFPMVPAPPPLKIPASRRKSPAPEEKSLPEIGSSSDSADEFVSLASSTTDLYSSDFTNPYGISTAVGASSQASSDRLSQFGTARDYHEFDMQNDLYWYKEKEEDYVMPPSLGNSDSFAGPSEDKFVMTFQVQNESDLKHESERLGSIGKINHSDNLWPFGSMDNVKDGVQDKDYYNFDERVHLEGGVKNDKSSFFDHNFYGGDPAFHSLMNGKENSMDFFHFEVTGDRPNECTLAQENETDKSDVYKDFKNTSIMHNPVFEKGSYADTNGNYEANDDKEVCRGSYEHDPAGNEGGSGAGDELIYSTNEEDHEVFNLRIIHRKNRTGFEENKDLPIVINSMIAGRYYVAEYLGSAAFSKVVQAHDFLMGVDVCLKIIKNDKDFFDQSLDEIKLLKFVNKHDPGDEHHILRLYDYFYHQEHLFIVCELLRANLYEFQKYNRESGGEPYFTMNRLQAITRQCLEALDYLHNLGIIHCDLKPENILIKSYRKCEIKVIDLGSSCFQTDNLSLYVQSRSYRAPEVILGHSYNQKIDLWSLGCILAELYSGEVLFPNDAIAMLLARMIGILGPIDMKMLATGQETDKYFTKEYDLYHINETNQLEYIIPKESSLEHHLQVSDVRFTDFLRYLLEINPLRRPTAREALEHPWLSYSYDFNSCRVSEV